MKTIFKIVMGTLVTIFIISVFSYANEIAIGNLPFFNKITGIFRIFYEHWNFVVAILIYTIFMYFMFKELQKELKKEFQKKINEQKNQIKDQKNIIVGVLDFFNNYLGDILTNIETHFDEDFNEHDRILNAVATLKEENLKNKVMIFKTDTDERIKKLNDSITKYREEKHKSLINLIEKLEDEPD